MEEFVILVDGNDNPIGKEEKIFYGYSRKLLKSSGFKIGLRMQYLNKS